MSKKRVLILCTANSVRSQMSEGLLRQDFGDRFEVFSAGVNPSRVHPEAIAAMADAGIDISGQRSKHVDEFQGQAFDTVITVCDNARDSCPFFPGAAKRLHWNFEDPGEVKGTAADRAAAFRKTRDQIREKFRAHVDQI